LDYDYTAIIDKVKSRSPRFTVPSGFETGRNEFSLTALIEKAKPFDLEFPNKKIVTFGRNASNDVVINSNVVSNFHGTFHNDNGFFYIIDKGSSNGIFLNGAKVRKSEPLEPGDVISFDPDAEIVKIVFANLPAGLWFASKKPVPNAEVLLSRGLFYYKIIPRSVSAEFCGAVKTVKGARKFGKKEPETILDDVSFKVEAGEFAAIIGGSGAGKSTLVNGALGVADFTEGGCFIEAGVRVAYVPQSDVVYGDLALSRALYYSAKLRTPDDATDGELKTIVAKVIKSVGLTGRENVLIKKLSGGQKKRAAIASELISDPAVFFLDEPAAGLDPGTERRLMKTLRDMSRKNKTVIVITHAAHSLFLCDKIAALGAGGKLCFFGTPKKALDFFNVKDFADIYDKINDNSTQWKLRFQKRLQDRSARTLPPKTARKNSDGYYNSSALKQFATLCARCLRLFAQDKKRLLLLALQAPLLGLALSLVAYKTNMTGEITVFMYNSETTAFLFSLSCAAFWIGLLNSIQEICKERDIFLRERMANLKLFPYIFSKLAVFGAICLLQTFLLLAGPYYILSLPSFWGMFATTFATMFSAVALGLLVSAFSLNPDRAASLSPLILTPQILFSGIAFKLRNVSKFLSNFVNCKWSLNAYCVLLNVNALPADDASEAASFIDASYAPLAYNLYVAWGALIFFTALCVVICAASLEGAK
jgi:ABC-type multidrug transport system ATPase subunit